MVPDSEEYENSEASELEIKPFTANEYSSQVPDEGALRGFGFLGKISNNAYSLALLVALEDGGTPKLYLGEIDNQGGGSNWTKVLVDNSNSPIPGYTKICSEWTGNLADVTQSMINFNREIPKNAKLLIEATIQGGPGPTSTIYATIPLVFAAINSTGQGVLFEYSAVSFSTGNASVGGVKLISMSAIMGAYGVQGLNVMIQPYNLSSSLQGAMLYIKGIYVKL